jgi:hypothetical protein
MHWSSSGISVANFLHWKIRLKSKGTPWKIIIVIVGYDRAKIWIAIGQYNNFFNFTKALARVNNVSCLRDLSFEIFVGFRLFFSRWSSCWVKQVCVDYLPFPPPHFCYGYVPDLIAICQKYSRKYRRPKFEFNVWTVSNE